MMGESSACLMRSFSHPSSSLHEATEGDPIRALTSSISFGRYMSESLAWEKWSSFTHNRYMEEVEKYSRPGSVAQMKAHFEAHYKRKAAERAAALLEQQNAAADSSSELNTRTEKQNDSSMEQELAPKDNHLAAEETQRVEAANNEIDFSVEVSGRNPSEEGRESVTTKIEEAKQPILVENQVILSHQLEDVEDAGKVMSNQENKTHVKDGAKFGDSATSGKKKSALSSTKSTVYSRVPKPPAPPKPTISLPKRPNINASPNCKKTTEDSTNRKKATPRSLHMSINFGSRETNKPLSPILQKIVNSRLVKTLAKASKDRTTQQTPTRASVDISKLPTVTPQRGNNRSRTSLNQSMSESGKVEAKSQAPFTGGSKSPNVCERKARSPIVSYSFSFKSEERAAKRKEFFERLEQKAKETEKGQPQAKLKEKSRCDYKDMHLSATSKPKKNSKFSQGIESPSDPIKKVPPMRPCSPKLGRKTPAKSQDINFRPPWRLAAKTDGGNDTRGKNNRAPAYSAKSVSKKTMHENASPNIQL